MATVENSLAVIENLEKVGLSVVKAVKAGGGHLAVLAAVFSILIQAKDMVLRAPYILGELKDLDPEETGKITAASHKLVLGILKAIAS